MNTDTTSPPLDPANAGPGRAPQPGQAPRIQPGLPGAPPVYQPGGGAGFVAPPFGHKKTRKRFSRTFQSFGVSFAIHVALFFAAGAFVVYRYVKPPEMMFKPAKKMPKMPARKLQHKIRVKQYEKQARKPKLMNKLVSKGKGKISLPKLPPVKFTKSDLRSLPTAITPGGGHIGQLGLGGLGMGKGGDGAFQGFSEAEFFGHKIKTKSIVILADSSSSVVKKGAFDDLRQEAVSMVSKFHPDTGFNLVLFTDGALAFKSNMVYATQARKKELAEWMQKKMKINKGNNPATKGSTPVEALRVALEMKPDTIIVITDDPPWLGKNSVEQRAIHGKEILKMVRDYQHSSPERVTINTVAYKPKETNVGIEARKFLKDLARANGGRFREVSAKR